MKKILLIRLDKIGDLISTMCVDQSVALKDYQITWAIAKGMGFIPDSSDPKRNYLELKKDDSKTSLKILQDYLRENKPDVAVSFQAPWWVNYALWSAGVPVRAGVKSQWHSFLFLNKGLRQKRSRAIKHEADYNLDLLHHALNWKQTEPTPILTLKAPRSLELLAFHRLTEKQYVVVHPGMAGSALNWPIGNYIALIKQLTTSTTVVLTGTDGDEPWLKDIKTVFKNDPKVLNLQSKLKTSELFTILKNSKAVVVPSTGVAHMAASLGANVIGLYSPMRVQHPTRWAARGEHVQIFMPTVSDIDQVDPNCMNEIQVSDVVAAIEKI